MNRRHFLQIGALSIPVILQACQKKSNKATPFKVVVHDDMSVGHLVRDSLQFREGNQREVKYLIVGGGIAGMSAAYQLRHEDFLLCELSDRLGGSSSAIPYNNTVICQGAHYDLDYPSYYGKEVLEMLTELNIIEHDAFSGRYKFIEKKYLIPNQRESRCYFKGQIRKEVLPDGPLKRQFIQAIQTFVGHMPMPTPKIGDQFRFLNDFTFDQWLQENLLPDPEFMAGINYNMRDDYGGNASDVSALAGIHYYSCRPYYTQAVELFSPPEGNHYFLRKIFDRLPERQLLTNHLVKHIAERQGVYEVDVVDVTQNEILKIKAENIIYAGHKHALKYVYPPAFELFADNVYAPWAIVNFLLDNQLTDRGFWQNEMLGVDENLIGFVDSDAQFTQNKDHRILSVYFCFKPEERTMMSLIPDNKYTFVREALGFINQYFDQDISGHVQKAFVQVMGHAMPVPKPGYLFHDKNKIWDKSNFAFAGVDNNRLPLLFEALDSGIDAVQYLKKKQLF